jgi:hypothetical protein
MAERQGERGIGVLRASGSERRTSARLPVEMWVEDLTDGGVVYRRAGNLSRGGLFLDQTIPLPEGSAVKLRFTLPGDDVPLVVDGQIVSVREGPAMGLKFIGLPPDVQRRIDGFCERSATPAFGVVTR